MAGQSKSVLYDLNIDPQLMLQDPEKFQELCLDAADKLFAVMDGRESTGDRKARELFQLAAKNNIYSLPEDLRAFKLALQEAIFDTDNGKDSHYSNEELVQISSILDYISGQVRDHVAERFNEDSPFLIRSKRAAASLYSRLRVIHDSWRQARKLFDDDKKQWKVIPGRPGNYKDAVPYTFYLFNGEEFTTWHYIVRCLSEHYDTDNIHNTADFHEFVEANPDCNVRIMTAWTYFPVGIERTLLKHGPQFRWI